MGSYIGRDWWWENPPSIWRLHWGWDLGGPLLPPTLLTEGIQRGCDLGGLLPVTGVCQNPLHFGCVMPSVPLFVDTFVPLILGHLQNRHLPINYEKVKVCYGKLTLLNFIKSWS